MNDPRAHGVIRLSKRTAAAPLDLRQHARVIPQRSPQHEYEPEVIFRQTSFATRALALFLVPLMLCYPLAPVFAEELASMEPPSDVSVPPPPTEQAGETAPVAADDSSGESVENADTSTSQISDAEQGDSTETPEGSIALVAADSAGTESADVAADDTVSSTEDASSEPSSEADASASVETGEPEVLGDTATSSEEVLVDPDADTGSSGDEGTASSTETVGDAGSESASSTPTTEAATSTASSTPTTEGGSTPASQNADTSDAELPSEEVLESEAVASVSISEAEREALRVRLMEEVKAEFLRGCVTLEKGGYYCLSDEARTLSSNSLGEAALSVSADTDGKGSDKEIFVTGSETTLQLTDNAVEDAFPSKDLSGRSVVWQSEVDGRWQIMVADLSSTTPIVTQLTAGRESNFNPAVEGETVVWQGWIDGNWEIFVAERVEGVGEDMGDDARHVGASPGWTVLQITHNQTHDMFPGIAGGMITWQAFDGSAWNVYAYSKATRDTVRISAGEGSAERPRFAMLWEERDADGRVRLMGYDVARGERVDVTEEARTAGNTRRAPGMPASPVSSPDQPALPLSQSASSTGARSEGDAPPDPLLP